MAPTRLPWPADFPEWIIHTSVRTRDAHYNYAAAKGGDADAALELAIDLLSKEASSNLREAIGEREALLLPVTAEETMGFNAIPDAMAQVLGRDLGLRAVAGEIVQTNKVGHTRARAFQRIVTPPAFAGPSSEARTMFWSTIMSGLAALSQISGDMSKLEVQPSSP